MNWTRIKSNEPICLKSTLFSGQVFNFVETDVCEFTGTMHFFVVVLRQENDLSYYKILATQKDGYALIDVLINRFFTTSLEYSTILQDKSSGLRLVSNNLIQTIFSFICSSNNNIKRISKMIKFLYSKGEFACTYRMHDFYYFPELHVLSCIVEELKDNKFGYRSKFIDCAAKMIANNTQFILIKEYDANLQSLISKDIDCKQIASEGIKVRDLLIKLPGIGSKVRDCISLMGLGLYDVVPIDTHIFKYAKKRYDIKESALTKSIYEAIQNKFKEEYGEYAGVHQLYIFREYTK